MSTKTIRGLSRKIHSGDNATQLDGLDGLAKLGPLAVDAIPALIKALDVYDNAVRSRAANVLGRMGAAAAAAVPKLNALLDDRSPAVRAAAARAVGRIGPVGVPDLIESLLFEGDEGDGQRQQAARALAALGGDARFAVPYLTHSLRDESARVKKESARALATLNVRLREREIKSLISILKSDVEPEHRPALAESLSIYAPVGKAAVPILRRLMQREPKPGKTDLRPAAIQALGRLGPVARPAVPDLLTLQTGDDSPLRSPALVALGRIGEGAAEAVPELLRLLPEAGEKRTLLIVEALGRIGPASEVAVPTLVEMLPNAYGALRETITHALGSIGKKAEPALPLLIQALADQSVHVRLDAIRAIGRIGIPDKRAVQTLLRSLENPEAEVRLATIDALAALHLNAGPLSPHLYKRLADRDGRVRRAAAHLLARLGVRDKRIADRCRKALESPYAEVRFEAAEFLWRFSRKASGVLPVMQEMITAPDRATRQQGLELLSEVGETDDKAFATLIHALDNPDEPIGRPAATALITAGSKAIPALLRALDDPRRTVRTGALHALARIASARKSAIPRITKALDDEEPEVRWAAAWALGAVAREAEAAVQPLCELLTDEVATVSGWAALSLSRFGETAVPALSRMLTRPELRTQIAVCRALALIGPPALPAMAQLGPLLREEDPTLRTAVNRVLDRIAGDIQAEAGRLLDLLDSSNRGIQEWAAIMLRPYGVRLLPILMRQLGEGQDEGDGDHVWGVTETLAELGERAEPALPLLLRVLEFEGQNASEIRDRVGQTLGRIGAAAVPTLIDALKHPGAEVRLGAIDGLSRIGEEAADAVSELLRLLREDTPPAVHRFIGEALADLGDEAISGLITSLRDTRDVAEKARFARALGVIGPKANEAIPVLTELLTHPEPTVRKESLWALGRVASRLPASESLLDTLFNTLFDPDPEVRELVPTTLGAFADAAFLRLERVLNHLDAESSIDRNDRLRALGEILRGVTNKGQLSTVADRVFPMVIERLKEDPDPEVRVEAARVLTVMSVVDASLVRASLAEALADSPTRAQVRIVEALASLGEVAEPELRMALKHPNGLVRRVAYRAIQDRKPADRVALATEYLHDRDWVISRDSARVLGEHGPDQGGAGQLAIDALGACLNSNLRETRNAALEALTKLDPDGEKTVPALINGLIHRSATVRAWSAEKIGAYGERAVESVPMLVLLGADWQFGVGVHARESLKKIGTAEGAVEAFKSILTHKKKDVRERALQTLRWMDWQAGNLLDPYVKQLGNPSDDVKEKIDTALSFLGGQAADTREILKQLQSKQGWHPPYQGAMRVSQLVRMDQLPADAIPELVEALTKNLTHSDYDVRRETATALGLIGPPAASAAPALAGCIGDTDNRVRVQAILALDRVGEVPEATLSELVKLLNTKKNPVENLRAAARVIGKQGSRAESAVPELRNNLKSTDWEVQLWTAWALGQIGARDEETLKELKSVLEAPHPRLQAWAAAMFASLSDESGPVCEVIRRVLPCSDTDSRKGLMCATSRIGEPAIEELIAALQHPDRRMRMGAVTVLGGCGVRTDDVTSTLDRAAEDVDAEVRKVAEEVRKAYGSVDPVTVADTPSTEDESEQDRRVFYGPGW